jgi:hypothetical protein
MIVSIVLYPSGFTGAIRSDNSQDGPESEPWYVGVLRRYMVSGQVGDSTIVSVPSTYSGAVAAVRRRFVLPPSPPNPQWFSIVFDVRGGTKAGTFGGEVVDLEGWYVSTVRDKLVRGVLSPDARVLVPNVYAGPAVGVPGL